MFSGIKLEMVDEAILKSLWRVKEKRLHYIPTRGVAGGVVLMWKEKKFHCGFADRGSKPFLPIKKLQWRGRMGVHWCFLQRE